MAKICLDPGHGGSDPGACKGRRSESDDVLSLSLAVKSALERCGIQVVLTRTADTDITINERCNKANAEKCDYFLSIHRNSAGSTANGTEIWVHSKSGTDTYNKAKDVLDKVVNVSGSYNRGVKKGAVGYTDYGVNKQTNMPSALLELLFISNDNENADFDKNFNSYAEAIAKGLCKVVGVSYKEISAPGSQPVKPIPAPAQPTNNNGGFEVMKKYVNGSTRENVFEDTDLKNKVGSLNPRETAECPCIINGRPLVIYKVDGTSRKKSGFVKWTGGVK